MRFKGLLWARRNAEGVRGCSLWSAARSGQRHCRDSIGCSSDSTVCSLLEQCFPWTRGIWIEADPVDLVQPNLKFCQKRHLSSSYTFRATNIFLLSCLWFVFDFRAAFVCIQHLGTSILIFFLSTSKYDTIERLIRVYVLLFCFFCC